MQKLNLSGITNQLNLNYLNAHYQSMLTIACRDSDPVIVFSRGDFLKSPQNMLSMIIQRSGNNDS